MAPLLRLDSEMALLLLRLLLLYNSLPSEVDQLTGLLGFSLPLSLRLRTLLLLLGQLYCCLLPLLLLSCGCGCFCLLPPSELCRSCGDSCGGGLLLGRSLRSCRSSSSGYQ